MTNRFTTVAFAKRFCCWAAASLSFLLAACNSGPSAVDVALTIGHAIEDVNCVQANGKPGHICTFNLRGYSQTRRMVKRDDGSWDALYN